MKYPYIRNQLGCYLHQDYDLDTGSVPDAIIRAIRESEYSMLLAELNSLRSEPDEVIYEVLKDHCLDIWKKISPRDFLTTIIVLTELFSEERVHSLANKNTEQVMAHQPAKAPHSQT